MAECVHYNAIIKNKRTIVPIRFKKRLINERIIIERTMKCPDCKGVWRLEPLVSLRTDIDPTWKSSEGVQKDG